MCLCPPVAPLCFLYNEPSKLYSVFREMYVRYFFRLHSVSSSTSVSLTQRENKERERERGESVFSVCSLLIFVFLCIAMYFHVCLCS